MIWTASLQVQLLFDICLSRFLCQYHGFYSYIYKFRIKSFFIWTSNFCAITNALNILTKLYQYRTTPSPPKKTKNDWIMQTISLSAISISTVKSYFKFKQYFFLSTPYNSSRQCPHLSYIQKIWCCDLTEMRRVSTFISKIGDI